jgi:HEAT repeat protein
MKTRDFMVLLLVMTFATSGLCQESALEAKVRALFLESEHGVPDRQNRLRQLGDDNQIASVLTRMASQYKHAKEGTLDFAVLNSAVASLGEFRARSANALLAAFVTDQKVHENVRALAARSLGQIDPEGNKKALLKALDPSEGYLIRVYAAEGLAKTRDAEALKSLERFGREEKDSYVRQEFEKASQSLRAKGVRPN